jgi:hypothetical protein
MLPIPHLVESFNSFSVVVLVLLLINNALDREKMIKLTSCTST